VDPVPDPLLLIKSGSAGNRTRDLLVSSQELWPVEHRGGLSRSRNKLKFALSGCHIDELCLLRSDAYSP
jgi:hypothetical protein